MHDVGNVAVQSHSEGMEHPHAGAGSSALYCRDVRLRDTCALGEDGLRQAGLDALVAYRVGVCVLRLGAPALSPPSGLGRHIRDATDFYMILQVL